jgi:hypothetical protein
MTTRAREALADCEHALADFKASANTDFQRTRWVALMTLLRTVGYVLKEVDRDSATPAMKQAIDAAWDELKASKPNPPIFWAFIKGERGDVVHLYEIRAAANIKVTVPTSGLSWAPVSVGGFGTRYQPATFDFFMRSGPFEGFDPLVLCREAIEFWRAHIEDIERRANQPVSTGL